MLLCRPLSSGDREIPYRLADRGSAQNCIDCLRSMSRCSLFGSVKAADEDYGVDPTPTAKKIRELFLNAHYVEDHCGILYALGFPDFVLGPTADPASRNLIGLISAVGIETGKLVLRNASVLSRSSTSSAASLSTP